MRLAIISGVMAAVLLSVSAGSGFAQTHTGPKVTWHWHMHQPIYWNAPWGGPQDRYEYAWDSIVAKDAGRPNPEHDLRDIFGKDDRVAAYQWRVRDTLGSIGHHPKSGASVSYSGALMKNVRSLGQAGQLGYTSSWKNPYNEAMGWTTPIGSPRLDLVNFSFHHGLMALLPEEIVRMELLLQQEIHRQEFPGRPVSKGFFPPEMAFSTRLIPLLEEVGIEWAIVSSEHIARACPDFPLVLGSGGVNCDPPNRADQINPPGEIFIREQIDRGCAPVSANPLSYQPAYARYVDPETGEISRIIVVPADQVWGWRDGYGMINAAFLDALVERNDPDQPSLVVLAHDGDNAWGGGYDYYANNVSGVADDAANRGHEATSIQQYLNEFPPDPDKVIHVEDGAWVNADSDFGSPSFINWNYPLLDANGNIDPVNGWHEKPREMAIFVATLNHVLTAQQLSGHSPDLGEILNPSANSHPVDRGWHYLLGSLDSGNVYYGTPLDFEIKTTVGCNPAMERVAPLLEDLSGDETPPTIWLPQRHPYNPGGLNFGVQYGYTQYWNNGDFHIWTFIHDVSGPVEAELKYRIDNDGVNPLDCIQNETYAGGDAVGEWQSLTMTRREFPKDDPYGKPDIDYWVLPHDIADHFSVEVTGLRDVLIDYYVEATDIHGNVARSPIQHVYIGTGEGATDPGGQNRVTIDPDPPVRGHSATLTYDPSATGLSGASQIHVHMGFNNWSAGTILDPRPAMTAAGDGTWTYTFSVPSTATQIDVVFTTQATGDSGQWDNNNGQDWHFQTVAGNGTPTPTPAPTPTGTATPTPTPTPPPGANPFVMDGQLDPDACEIDGGLYVAVRDGWLYLAADVPTPEDVFLYVIPDPSFTRDANWAKAGRVPMFSYFLAREGTNDFSSWFGGSEQVLPDGEDFVHFRPGTGSLLEGAIRLSLFEGVPYVAMGVYGTNDGDALMAQSPPGDGDGDIDPDETIRADEACFRAASYWLIY